MERLDAGKGQTDVHPVTVVQIAGSLLRRLRVLFYLTIALALVAVLGAFLPLGTWLLLCVALAAPTLASALLVASE